MGEIVPGEAASYASRGRELLAREGYVAAAEAFRAAARLDPHRADYHAGLGQALLSQRLYPAAEKAFSEAAELQPDSAEYQGGLGKARLAQRYFSDAETAFRKAMALQPERPDYCAGLGQALLAQEQHAAAEELLRLAVAFEPDNEEYIRDLERARSGRERYEAPARTTIGKPANAKSDVDALEALRLGMRRYLGANPPGQEDYQAADPPDLPEELHAVADPADANASARSGRRLLGQRQYKEAEAAFREALRHSPDRAEYRAGLGYALLGQRRYRDAAKELREAIRLAQGRTDYHAALGRAQLGQERYDEAEAAFREAVRRVPDRADYRAGLGYALLGQRRYQDAAKELREAIRLDRYRADHHAALGRAQLGQEHYDEAGSAFTEALRLAPDYAEYLSGLGKARLGQKRYREAGEAFQQAIDQEPDRAESIGGLGRALLGEQRYLDAERILSQAIDLQPSAEYLGSLGEALLRLSRSHEAEAAFRKAVDLRPESADYQAGLGEALLGQKRYQEAERAFSEAVKCEEDNAFYHFELGQAQASLQQYESAETKFRLAVSLEPFNLRYRASLGKVLLCQDRIEDAQLVLDEAVALDPGADETISLRQAISESYDDAIVTHIMQVARRALDAERPDVATIQDDRYLDHVRTLSLQNLPSIREPFREWRSAARLSVSRPSRLRSAVGILESRASRTVAILLIVPGLAIAANAITISISKHYIFPALQGYALPFSALSSLAVFALLLALTGPSIVSRRELLTLLPLRTLEDRLDTLINNVILEPAITAALGVIWRDSDQDIVTVEDGPELNTKAEPDNIVATEAFRQLSKALGRTHGTAVGVAGPRGSGKTELARSFTELGLHRSPTRTIPLMLWAPVRYDAQSFLLRLLKELCINVISVGCGKPLGSTDAMLTISRRHRNIIVYSAAFLLIAAGGLLIAAKFAAIDFRALAPVLAGIALIVVGASAALVERTFPAWLSRSPIHGDLVSPKTMDLAIELRSRVEFTETYSKGSSLGVSGRGFGATSTTGRQLARLPLNEVDIVRELRNMVEALAADHWGVLIAIDEVDKIPDEEEALSFLNNIKVLFPIHECSFIVSVSQDAWALFECRGLPLRNAFDSSFDEIILLDMLQPQESRDLLKRRCRDITDAQALLCHCLSGGLPRDLLRSVRFLARVASSVRDDSGRALPTPSLDDVLQQLFNEDLVVKVAAARRGMARPPEELSTMDHEQLLLWINSRCSDIAAGIQPEPSRICAYVSFLETVRRAFAVGGPLSRLDDKRGFDDSLITEGFDLLAQARRGLSGDRGVSVDVADSFEMLERACDVLGISRPARPALSGQR